MNILSDAVQCPLVTSEPLRDEILQAIEDAIAFQGDSDSAELGWSPYWRVQAFASAPSGVVVSYDRGNVHRQFLVVADPEWSFYVPRRTISADEFTAVFMEMEYGCRDIRAALSASGTTRRKARSAQTALSAVQQNCETAWGLLCEALRRPWEFPEATPLHVFEVPGGIRFTASP